MSLLSSAILSLHVSAAFMAIRAILWRSSFPESWFWIKVSIWLVAAQIIVKAVE